MKIECSKEAALQGGAGTGSAGHPPPHAPGGPRAGRVPIYPLEKIFKF